MGGRDLFYLTVAAAALALMVAAVVVTARGMTEFHERKRVVAASPRASGDSGPGTGDELAPVPGKGPAVPMPASDHLVPSAPAPAASTNEPAEIDRAAVVRALSAVAYKDCGTGGPRRVQIAINRDGSVALAAVTSGQYADATKKCILKRFKEARMTDRRPAPHAASQPMPPPPRPRATSR